MRISAALFAFVLTAAFSAAASAAVTCTLDHPDRDVKRLFPESTTYRVRELIPFRHGSKDFMKNLARDLGSELDPEFETAETPHTFYAVYKANKQIGLLFGVNARATDGPMQIFIAYARNGHINDIYVQKISSADATAFRSKYYREQYRRFTLSTLPEESDIKPPVRSPSTATLRDHNAFLRGVRLNALLVRELYNKFKD